MKGRKAAIRQVLLDVADVAESAGLSSTARDVREVRVPKLDEERFQVVVLGEFNHGKSTLINALLGDALLPVGITPTTAVLAHIRHGDRLRADLILESGARRSLDGPLDARKLSDWLTVAGEAARQDASSGSEASDPLAYVEIFHSAPFLKDNVTLVDTPGVNDINEQRAEITYGYVPRADAALFLLDATQILTG